jgi:tetratricopeptide (TPR) repeat protein
MSSDGARQVQKGNGYYYRGCYQQAVTHFYRAHVEFTAADDLPGVAVSLNSLGNVYQANGDVDNAVAFFNEALAISQALGDRQAAQQALANKAAALIGADRLDEAAAIIAEAEDGAAESFLPLQINKGILLMRQADYPRAQAVLTQALAGTDSDDRISRAKIQVALGRLMQAQENPAAAVEHFQQALTLDRAVGFYRGLAQTHTHLGEVYRKQGAFEQSLGHYKRAVKIYALLNDTANVRVLMEALDQVAAETGADIRLTVHFVKTWLEDKSLRRPCR